MPLIGDIERVVASIHFDMFISNSVGCMSWIRELKTRAPTHIRVQIHIKN